METVKHSYRLSELHSYKNSVDVLKLCPTVSHSTSVKLNRAGKIIGKVLEEHTEDIDVIRKKHIEKKKADTGVQDESKLEITPEDIANLNREIDEMVKTPYVVELPHLSIKDFPGDPKTLGVRKTSKVDTTGRMFEIEIHFYDHFLTLLGELIDDAA